MASLCRFKCARCTTDFWSEWHLKSDMKTREPDIDVCGKCLLKAHEDNPVAQGRAGDDYTLANCATSGRGGSAARPVDRQDGH